MNLRPYQTEGRDFLAARRCALLADEMRVGKTPQAILAAQKIGAEEVMVVCPAIAVPHWQQEWVKWWPMSGRPTILSYDAARRANYGPGGPNGEWDLLIVDECHYAKNPEAKRTKMIYAKDGLGWHAKHVWALSGTPAPKHAGELWPMLRAFGVVGATYEQFCRHYCDYDWTKTRITGTKVKFIPELKALLATVMLRRTRKQVAPDMPGIDFQFLPVEPETRADLPRAYGLLRDDELLAQMEAHSTADREDRVAVAKAKVGPLVEHIDFALGNELLQQTVVFGWHTEPLEMLTAELRKRGYKVGLITGKTGPAERVEIQYAFRRGELQVVVGNILAAGTAIDLSARRHGYFLELDWLSSNNMQAANRLVSMDKEDKVTFDVASLPGSVDDRVQRILMRRSSEVKAMGL